MAKGFARYLILRVIRAAGTVWGVVTLVFLLAERFKATQKVGILKATHKLPAGDPGREAAQIARLRRLAEDAHLDPAFAEKFLNFIISEVIRHHEAIAENHQTTNQQV